MKAFKGAAMFLLLLSLAALPASAHCMEVGFKVMNLGGETVSIPIAVYDLDSGILVASANSMPGPSGYNFWIDFNGNCDEPDKINVVALQENQEYRIEFRYPGYPEDEYPSLCFFRGGCYLGTYDTYYQITPETITTVTNRCEEINWDYPFCESPEPTTDLAVALQILDTEEIGDKVVFYLRATASGGTGSYLFAWDGASRISPTEYTNPNLAKRTILRSQTAEVTVTVTSGGVNVEKTITLRGGRIP